MNKLKLPFAIVAFLLSITIAVMAFADLDNPVWGPIRQFLGTINPILTGFLAFWVARDTQRKQQLADDYLADLLSLTSDHVRLFYRIGRIVDDHHSFEVPTGFVRENSLHKDLRKLRRARLLSGTEGSRFKAGRRFVLARWTDRLRGLGLKTANGEAWGDIEKLVAGEDVANIKANIATRAVTA